MATGQGSRWKRWGPWFVMFLSRSHLNGSTVVYFCAYGSVKILGGSGDSEYADIC